MRLYLRGLERCNWLQVQITFFHQIQVILKTSKPLITGEWLTSHFHAKSLHSEQEYFIFSTASTFSIMDYVSLTALNI